MKLINFISILMIVLADIAFCSIEATLLSELTKNSDNNNHDKKALGFYSSQSIKGEDRFNLFETTKQTRRLTCKRAPRVCRAKGSPGPNCCKKKCVNLLSDRRNCGKCGKKCKYNQICCNGKCVNPSFNKSHCGGCNNKCGSGGLCAFGLCSYA